MGLRTCIALLVLIGVLALASTAEAGRKANVAALQWSPSGDDLRELDRLAPTARDS